jgi:hypothetical protein
MSRAMSRSGRPPLAGGSAVAAEKNISKLLRHYLSSRRAADRAKLLVDLAGNRAGHPASLAAAPLTPSTPTLQPTRSERYALRSAEKSIDKMLAEHSSHDGAEHNLLAEVMSSYSRLMRRRRSLKNGRLWRSLSTVIHVRK